MVEFYVEDGVLRARDLTPGSAEDCLLKWSTLYGLAMQGILAEDGGLSTCSFCQVYLRNPGCRGCPLAKATGELGCVGTSYYDYVDAIGDDDIEAAIEATSEMVDLLTDIWRAER